MSKVLVVDSGNTRVKWALFESHNSLATGYFIHEDSVSFAKLLHGLPKPSLIVVSNVAGLPARRFLFNLFLSYDVTTLWVRPTVYQCGVSNHYRNSTQLGSDRWAALIAAWRFISGACLVINVGTTMTIDMLSNTGEFMGGVITPGPYLMFTSLQEGSSIPNLHMGKFDYFPVCTADAVKSGTINSLVGAIDRVYQLYNSKLYGHNLDCILTGGASAIIYPYIKFPVRIIDNLVLNGLFVIADDMISSNKNLTTVKC